MTTLLFEDERFTRHEVPQGHAESPDRIAAIAERFGLPPFDKLKRGKVRSASVDDIEAVHPRAYLEALRRAAPDHGLVALDPDTFLGPRGFETALLAAGAATAAVDAVMSGSARNAFCAIRPPGHHANATTPMGFCILNNAAVAARRAQRNWGAERVAIIDWDVHHGNGTQDIFWDDPTVFYASTHQSPLYPYTGAATETGAGNILNIPLPAGTDGAAYRPIFAETLLPAIREANPDLIVISAGFDAHRADPLGGLLLDAADFGWATEQLMAVAEDCCAGRIVSLLEGGYDLDGLADSAAAHVSALMR